MSVNFSRDGRYLFTMQRRQPPYLYLTNEPKVAATFMDEKGEYMNVVSMKSGCFVGTDDEARLYAIQWAHKSWRHKIPPSSSIVPYVLSLGLGWLLSL